MHGSPPFLALLVTLGSFAGCSGDPSSAPCEPNPDLGLPPQSAEDLRLNSWGSNSWGSNSWGQNGTALGWVVLNHLAFDPAAAAHGRAPNELVAPAADGSLVGADALVGATLSGVLADGRVLDLVVASFARSDDGKLAYYTLTQAGANICDDGGQGLFLPGVWDATGARHDSLRAGDEEVSVTFSCTTGVIGKCVRWGYAPWDVGSDLHQTCTRLARADYCGNGISYTKTGTLIDYFDTQGSQKPVGLYPFEAGWGPDGAVCVSHTRYDARTADGTSVLPSCWSQLPRCSTFVEARAFGATMGDASEPAPRLICNN